MEEFAALDEARKHVAKAKVHYDLGEFKESGRQSTSSFYRLRPIPAVLFNIAQAYRRAPVRQGAAVYKAYCARAQREEPGHDSSSPSARWTR